MDDLEFVQRCVKGDKQAWDEFLKTYSRLIYNYIHNTLKIKGHPAAQENINDLFQEIFLSLTKDNFKKLKSFQARNGCSLASWLRQVTVNIAIDYLRKSRPALSLEQEDEEGLSLKDILADGSPPVSAAFEQEERLWHLKDCIKGLAREDKYFLELHLNQGVGLEELSRHLGVSRGVIDMRKHRIIDRLKECFKNKGFRLDF